MKLEIELKQTALPKSFGLWLTLQMRAKLIKALNYKRLQMWDKYLSSKDQFQTLSKKSIKAKDIIIAGISNLQVQFTSDLMIIKINPNVYVSGLHKVKLTDVCNLINYGNLEMRAYPILTYVFEHTAENITSYVEIYQRLFKVRKHGRKILR